MRVLVSGFPYVRERYFATFRSWPEAGGISFILPRTWPAKDGAVVFTPPDDANITKVTAYFSHSHYPVIGGLLKGFMPSFAVQLWRRRREVDLVYSCSEPTLLTTLYQAIWTKALGIKHVCFTWENIPYEDKFSGMSRLIHAVILRLNLFLSDGLICGNQAGAEIHRRYTSKPIAVIPMNGLDTDQFQPDPEARRQSRFAGKVVFTFIGAIGYRKGIHLILDALPQVLEKVPNAHLVIAGNGEYEKEIDGVIADRNLSERVTRMPWIDHQELVGLLAVSDIFVYPSIPNKGWAEQFGYSMAEASLMELPVISTHSGSIADVVRDGRTGVLVRPNDVDQLAIAMIQLGEDEQLRHRLGQAGRKFVIDNFSDEIIARRFHEFFRLIVGQKTTK